ncbi:MAG: hypothetical protein CL916_07900, partial [Deltaproteobacteria bacterium]|nr:hypothetical protein [Deltaproteobacteria bacterium]
MLKRICTAWYTPCLLFFVFHYLLWFCLDLSDIPGAAGTLHLYESMRGSQRPYEMSSIYQWITRKGFSYSFAMWSTSFFGVFLGFWGAMIGAWAYDGKTAMRSLAWILLFWPPIHLYGWLIGVDSLVFGLSFFGSGLIWAALRLRFWGLLLIPIGGVFLHISLLLKLITVPILLCVLLAPVVIRDWNRWNTLLVALLLVTLVSVVPEFSSDGKLQGGLRIPEVDWLPVAMGWDRLRGMPAMGMPEGKWDQLIILCVLAGIICRRKSFFRTIGSVCASLILIVLAFVLEDRLGTRLLVPSSFGVLVILSSLFRKWVYFLPIVVGGLGLEMWAFVDQFQERRVSWANTRSMNIPRAPSFWRAQYPANPTIFRGLSLYGGAQARSEIENTPSSMVYSMRLRDGRENSLFVYAHLEGKETRTLDVKHCCVRSADEKCAKEVIASIVQKGGLILIPTEVDNWDRVYSNEKRWNRALLKEIRKQKSY